MDIEAGNIIFFEIEGLSLNQFKFTSNFVNAYRNSYLLKMCKVHRCTKKLFTKNEIITFVRVQAWKMITIHQNVKLQQISTG